MIASFFEMMWLLRKNKVPLNPKALALMGAASFLSAYLRMKRYSGQQEKAPENHLPFILRSSNIRSASESEYAENPAT
jgi:hypothetical protein